MREHSSRAVQCDCGAAGALEPELKSAEKNFHNDAVQHPQHRIHWKEEKVHFVTLLKLNLQSCTEHSAQLHRL